MKCHEIFCGIIQNILMFWDWQSDAGQWCLQVQTLLHFTSFPGQWQLNPIFHLTPFWNDLFIRVESISKWTCILIGSADCSYLLSHPYSCPSSKCVDDAFLSLSAQTNNLRWRPTWHIQYLSYFWTTLACVKGPRRKIVLFAEFKQYSRWFRSKQDA